MRIHRSRFHWLAGGAMLSGLIAGGVAAQPPATGAGGPPAASCQRTGALHRMIHHTAHTVHDRFIGDPETFIEPPLGTYVREQMTLQVAKADSHRFALYRSDFLAGTDKFSPTGAARFNLMYSRTAAWPGPILLEWTPDQPGLADARKQAVLAAFQRGGRPVDPERVVIGPSPYPGAMGAEAAPNFNNVLYRSQQGQYLYPLSPAAAATSYQTGGTN